MTNMIMYKKNFSVINKLKTNYIINTLKIIKYFRKDTYGSLKGY